MSNSKLRKLVPIGFARKLRSNQTDEEEKLWRELRDRRFANFKFRRQQILGKYIADFLCTSRKLIIEADGAHHDVDDDKQRDDYLRKLGYRVMRFSNHDIKRNLPMVLDNIWMALHNPKFDPGADPPHPPLRGTFSLKGEG